MRKLILFLAAVVCWAQPSFVYGPKVTNSSHSTVRVSYITSSNPTSSAVDYGSTTSYGTTRTCKRNTTAMADGNYRTTCLISGLPAGETWHLRGNLNGGSVLSADVPFALGAVPAVHPVLPTAPSTFSVSVPSIDGSTYNVDANCSNLSSILTTIVSLSDALNYEIVIPAGTTCTGAWNFPIRSSHTGWVVVRSSAVGTSAFPPAGVRWTPNWSASSTLAKFVTPVLGCYRGVQTGISSATCAASFYGEGGFVYNSSGPANTIFGLMRCSDSNPAYTGATTISSCTGTNPATITVVGHTLVEGQMVNLPGTCMGTAGNYFVYGVSGDTFKVYAASTTPGTGTMTVRNQYRNPTHTKGSGPPAGACTTEQWYYDTTAAAHEGYWCVNSAWVKFTFPTPRDDSTHSTIEVLGDKYYFVGIEATSQQVPGYPNSYPLGWNVCTTTSCEQGHISRIVYVNPYAEDVVFDRSYIWGQPKPSRVHGGIRVEGDRFALVESYLSGFQEWRMDDVLYEAGGAGDVAQYRGNQALIRNNYLEAAGINYFGPNNTYGEADAGFPSDVVIQRNTFKKLPEWRKTASQTTQYPNRHPWELKHGKRYLLEGNIFDYQWSNINAAAFVTTTPRYSALPTARTLTGWNAGVLTLASLSYTFEAGDVIYVYSTDAQHNGLWEVASNGCPSACDTITLAGSPTGSGSGGGAQMVASGRSIEDIDIRHNSFYQGTELYRFIGTDTDSSATFYLPQSKRLRLYNNLVVDMNIDSYVTGGRVDIAGKYAGGDNGARMTYNLGDTEDTVFTHNTIYGTWGNVPTFLVYEYSNYNYSEGLTLTDNLATFDESNFSAIRDTGTGTAVLNAYFKSGTSTSWSSTKNALCCGWSGYSGSYPAGYYWPAAQTDVKWLVPQITAGYDFRLRHDSPYVSGGASRASDDLNVGADVDAIESTQGRVKHARARSITATTATISYLAPDSAACTVEYGTSATWGTGTRASDGGGDRARNVDLPSLSSGTTYHVRVLCAVEQPSITFRTL